MTFDRFHTTKEKTQANNKTFELELANAQHQSSALPLNSSNADLDNDIDDIIQEFEGRCEREVLHTVMFYYISSLHIHAIMNRNPIVVHRRDMFALFAG